MTALGVYVGNNPSDLAKFTSWLGDEPDYVHGVVGYSNWKDFTSSASWQLNLWKPTGVDIQWSIPLISKEGNLGTAASGAYNQYYRSVAETLLKGTPGDGPIMVRTGWEANGDWFFWNAIGKEEAFKGAFRQMSSTFKEVSDRFQFEWNINHANGGIDPATIYPGDEYVDVIGMDFYYKPEYQGNDPVAAFNRIVNEKYGLQWLENFAKQHNKPTAYSEWGVKGDNAGPFVQLAKEWFEKHNPVLQSYWDSDAAYPGKLSDNSDPRTGAVFKDAFRNWGDGEMTWSDFGGRDGVAPPKPGAQPNIPTENGSGNETAGKPPGSDDPVAPTTPPTTPAPPADPTTPTAPTSPVVPAPVGDGPKESGSWNNQSWGGANWSGSDRNDWHQSSGGGKDVMRGGKGDDTYVVMHVNDKVVETAGEGVDTVLTWLSYTLPEHVENLTLFGTGWASGTGNASSNIILGNEGNNVLNGKGGKNILTGGKGADTFVIEKGQGSDTVTDFSAAQGDTIRLDGFTFANFAEVRAAASQVGADVVISLGGGQALTLKGTSLASLNQADFSLVNIQPKPITPVPAPAPEPSPGAGAALLPESGLATNLVRGTSKGGETLVGTSANDRISAQGGGDTMIGGRGGDTYEVFSLQDRIVELQGEGIDTVTTWLSYTLPDNVENLVLFGTGWSSGTGNGLANRIVGNGAPNVLDGRGGDDWLFGGAGADTFVVRKGEGNDTIADFSTTSGDVVRLDGFSFKDFAAVKAASAQSGADVVVKLSAGHTLTLKSVSLGSLQADDFALVNVKAPVAAPVLTKDTLPTTGAGTKWIDGTSKGGEILVGTAANDVINGKGSGDSMKGGAGDDTYLVNHASDTVVELAGQGTDTVQTWLASYTLPENVENLMLTGTSWSIGTGNALENRIVGNDAPNTLDGKGGNDVLIGGRGGDTFVIGKGQGTDLILDFQGAGAVGGDTLLLKGFGHGAVLGNAGNDFFVTAGDGSVTHFTLAGVTALSTGDYAWG